MSGRQTYKEILKLYPNQKAVVVSGFSENDDVKATLELGANRFIKKPYSMSKLGRVVKEAFYTAKRRYGVNSQWKPFFPKCLTIVS